jgi:HSP20 family protein
MEMDSLIHRFSDDFNGELAAGLRIPSMDVAETDKAYEAKFDVPGFKPDEVHVEVQGDTLMITGEHKEEKEEKNKTWRRIERRSGSIRREIRLPAPVDTEKVAAQCRDGILTVTLPKTEESRTKKIAVKS